MNSFLSTKDNVIIPRSSQTNGNYNDITIKHLEEFAKDGFRTLILAYRVISEDEYKV